LQRKYHQVESGYELQKGVVMGTFGENLRREREMRGVTLEEISDATKISVRALRAMEADQFEKLPGGIFTRSFVRTYAKYLGLDEEKIMAEFQLVAPASAQPEDLHRISQQRSFPQERRSRAGLAALLVALLVLAGGYAYYRFATRTPKAPATSAQPAPERPPVQAASPTSNQPQAATTNSSEAAAAGGTAESAAPGPQSAPGTNPPAAGSQAASTATAEDGLVLQVAATEQTWVAVSADGKSSSQRTMQANEIETFRAKNSFDVITGNAEGIILTLNGKTLDPLGRRGETKKVHLTLSDAQNPNP
jgi:cytoskeleton protein RodZ